MSRIPETTDLSEKLNESTPVFYGCLLLLLTLRFNAMINVIQQRTFSRLCCEVWSSQIVSQSWNIKFPSSTHHVLIAEAGEGTNARGEIQAICYSLCKSLTIFLLSKCFAILCTPCQKLICLRLLQVMQMQLLRWCMKLWLSCQIPSEWMNSMTVFIHRFLPESNSHLWMSRWHSE